jgi:predicted amidophosphoribosyltransferase
VTTPVDCPNCGSALAGAYCSACGQKADVRIVSLGQLLAEAIGDLYNFD